MSLVYDLGAMVHKGKESVTIEHHVLTWLAHQEQPSYLVGGCVRDRVLGRPARDLDLVVAQGGLALARRLANRFGGAYFAMDEERGTGRAILAAGGEDLVVDVAEFRGADLAADLEARDFTINALAASVQSPDTVIDLHNGLEDLHGRILRPVTEASIRDDPLRALRAVRLAADLNFDLAPETERLIRRDGGALPQVSAERVRDEMARMLAHPRSASQLFCLDDLNLLGLVFPELEALRGLVQPAPHVHEALPHSLQAVHGLDELLAALAEMEEVGDCRVRLEPLAPFARRILDHVGQSLGEVRPRLVALKLAALLHDTGKPMTRTVDDAGRIRFLDHPEAGVQIAGDALRRLRFNRLEVRLTTTVIRHHMRPLLLAAQEQVSKRAVYRLFRDVDDAGVDVLLHALADHRATYGLQAPDTGWRDLVGLVARMLGDLWERGPERVHPPSLVSGHDLMREFGLGPGPQIGRLLEAVREAQVSGEVNSRGEALALIRRYLAQSTTAESESGLTSH